MKHNIINTENYLLIVDDSEIKEGDYIYCNNEKEIVLWQGSLPLYHLLSRKKIIAHLPLNNSPILEGVDLLPPLEDEVDKLAEEYADYKPKNSQELRDVNLIKIGYKAGYNKAKEKYKYTEEDIENAFNSGRGYGNPEHTKDLNSFIQFLQQPKMPVGFECEMEDIKMLKKRAGGVTYFGKPKTTTNSQGLTQWVGEWIY